MSLHRSSVFLTPDVVKYDPSSLGNHKTQIRRLTVMTAPKASGFISGNKAAQCFDQIPRLPAQTTSQHVMLKPHHFGFPHD